MRPTLEAALTALFEGRGTPLAAEVPEDADAAGSGSTDQGAAGADDQPATPALTPETAVDAVAPSTLEPGLGVVELVERLRVHQDAAAEALQAGDWIEFGRQMDGQEQVIRRLEELAGAP